MEKIEILHTNDLHSHLENWPKIRRYLQQKQTFAKRAHRTLWTFDLGDFSDRWHPLTEATHGRANVRLMNSVHYTAATIGNNEGVGNPKEDLQKLYIKAEFPILLGNLIDPETQQSPPWAKEYEILTTTAGTRVAVFGLTAAFPLTYAPNGWKILNPEEVLPNLIKKLKPQVDIMILLSHLGIGLEEKIAATYPEIQVILGSHTHHVFEKGKKIKHTLLGAAGKYGEYVGEIVLELEDKKIKSENAWLVKTCDLPEEKNDGKEIQSYYTGGQRLLQQQVIGDLPQDFSKDFKADSSFIRLALSALKKRTGLSVAILNSGLFLKDLKKGEVTADDFHEALPHPMHLIQVTLKGKDFTRLILEMEKSRFFLRRFPIKGMGFRGKIFGEICYSGVSYDPKRRKVTYLRGEIQPEKSYSFVTVDHFMFVPFFPTIELVGQVQFIFPEFLREVVGNYVATTYPISKKQAIMEQ